MKGFTIFTMLTALFISGCSTTNNTSSKTNTVAVTTAQAASEPQKYRGTKVYWGGTILGVKNHKDYSIVEVLRYPLSGAEPDDNRKAQGRFLVKMSEFVDPAEYKSPNRLTVTGTLEGIQNGKVGNYPYTYPIIKAEKVRFWKNEKVNVIRDPYWWSHPYYRPWPYWHGRW